MMGGGAGPGRGPTKGDTTSSMAMWPGHAPRASQLYSENQHVILKQSETGDTLWGYSASLGKWTKLAIPKGKDLLRPTLGGGMVGIFSGEGRVYAFSESTGRWAELKTTALPTLALNKITVTDADQMFIFSDVTGRWSSNTDATDEPSITTDSSHSADLDSARRARRRCRPADRVGRF